MKISLANGLTVLQLQSYKDKNMFIEICHIIYFNFSVRGDLIFDEEFNTIDESKWTHFVSGWRGGNWEFQYYRYKLCIWLERW